MSMNPQQTTPETMPDATPDATPDPGPETRHAAAPEQAPDHVSEPVSNAAPAADAAPSGAEPGASTSLAVVLADPVDLRLRVQHWVMRALAERELDRAAARDILREVFDGLGAGLPERGTQAASAAREALHGVDEALGRSINAVQMALDEAWGQGRGFAETDLAETINDLKGLEGDLLNTLKAGADKGQGLTREVLGNLHSHLSRTGADTGSQLKTALEGLSNRLAAAAHGTRSDLRAQAQVSGRRLRAVASGILRGLADGMDRRA